VTYSKDISLQDSQQLQHFIFSLDQLKLNEPSYRDLAAQIWRLLSWKQIRRRVLKFLFFLKQTFIARFILIFGYD
jgi:hypothetical protein